MASNRSLKVETPEQSRAMLLSVLDNSPAPARDIVMFNAAAALYAANVVDSIEAGIAQARDGHRSRARPRPSSSSWSRCRKSLAA